MRYFVSGHRDLTMEEFDRHYVYQLDRVLAEDPYAEFVVGDWEGCDTIFVKYILCIQPRFWNTQTSQNKKSPERYVREAFWFSL